MDAGVRRAVAENEYRRIARDLCDARIADLQERRKNAKKEVTTCTTQIKNEKAKKQRLTALRNDDLLVFMNGPVPPPADPVPPPGGHVPADPVPPPGGPMPADPVPPPADHVPADPVPPPADDHVPEDLVPPPVDPDL